MNRFGKFNGMFAITMNTNCLRDDWNDLARYSFYLTLIDHLQYLAHCFLDILYQCARN